MSEYQYYEFQAIDRPLTVEQMQHLRSYSTRARITSTSFINDYSWGSFKGDEEAWMEEYFDAFLYLANWGTHVFKLRLPAPWLEVETAQAYCGGESFWIRRKRDNVIVSFVSEDEQGDPYVETEDCLSSLIGLRCDLARGDLRSLYLGWLLCAQDGQLDDEEPEPPVPPGLGQLTAPLIALIEFLRIDGDLLDVAAEASAEWTETRPSRQQVLTWLHELPSRERDNAIAKFIANGDTVGAMELRRRFLKQRDRLDRQGDVARAPRTVGQLLDAAEVRAERRRQEQSRKAAEAKARREREAAMARATYLNEIAGRQPQLWSQVDRLIATTKPKNYAQAIDLLRDLHDLARRESRGREFQNRIEEIATTHARKPALLERLRKAALMK